MVKKTPIEMELVDVARSLPTRLSSWHYKRAAMERHIGLAPIKGGLKVSIPSEYAMDFEDFLNLIGLPYGSVSTNGVPWVEYHMTWEDLPYSERKFLLLVIEEIAEDMGII